MQTASPNLTQRIPIIEETVKWHFVKQLPNGINDQLGVDYVDYYWLHGLNAQTYRQAEKMHAFDFIQTQKAEDKIHHIGLSFHDKAELLDEILTAHPELSIASWAIRFAASPSHVMMVLSGMSDEQQVADNISYMKDFQPLDEKEQQVVDQAVKIIRASEVIPCTACRYCTDTCPKKIAIPDYFALYNNMKRSGDTVRLTTQTYYSNLTQNHGKASECLKCGKCEKLCPQHLPIRAFLQDVAAALE